MHTGTRRTFLVGLGRFALGAAAASIVKPPVLYSFPSEIRIPTLNEIAYIAYAGGGKLELGWETLDGNWIIDYYVAGKFYADRTQMERMGKA